MASWTTGPADIYIHTAGGFNEEENVACRWAHSRVHRRLIIDNTANTTSKQQPRKSGNTSHTVLIDTIGDAFGFRGGVPSVSQSSHVSVHVSMGLTRCIFHIPMLCKDPLLFCYAPRCVYKLTRV